MKWHARGLRWWMLMLTEKAMKHAVYDVGDPSHSAAQEGGTSDADPSCFKFAMKKLEQTLTLSKYERMCRRISSRTPGGKLQRT